MKYLIKDIKFGTTEDGVACEPIEGNIVVTIEFQDDISTNWLSMVEIFGIPEFYYSDEDIFEELLKESDDFIEKTEHLIIKEFNGIQLGEYEDIIKNLRKPFDENDKSLIKLIIAVMRLDYEDTNKLIEDSIGKYSIDINIPNTDLDEDF